MDQVQQILDQVQQFFKEKPWVLALVVMFVLWYFFVKRECFSSGTTAVKDTKALYGEEEEK